MPVSPSDALQEQQVPGKPEFSPEKFLTLPLVPWEIILAHLSDQDCEKFYQALLAFSCSSNGDLNVPKDLSEAMVNRFEKAMGKPSFDYFNLMFEYAYLQKRAPSFPNWTLFFAKYMRFMMPSLKAKNPVRAALMHHRVPEEIYAPKALERNIPVADSSNEKRARWLAKIVQPHENVSWLMWCAVYPSSSRACLNDLYKTIFRFYTQAPDFFNTAITGDWANKNSEEIMFFVAILCYQPEATLAKWITAIKLAFTTHDISPEKSPGFISLVEEALKIALILRSQVAIDYCLSLGVIKRSSIDPKRKLHQAVVIHGSGKALSETLDPKSNSDQGLLEGVKSGNPHALAFFTRDAGSANGNLPDTEEKQSMLASPAGLNALRKNRLNESHWLSLKQLTPKVIWGLFLKGDVATLRTLQWTSSQPARYEHIRIALYFAYLPLLMLALKEGKEALSTQEFIKCFDDLMTMAHRFALQQRPKWSDPMKLIALAVSALLQSVAVPLDCFKKMPLFPLRSIVSLPSGLRRSQEMFCPLTDVLIHYKIDLAWEEADSRETILHKAARHGATNLLCSCVRALKSKGQYDPNVVDAMGNTPLHYAIQKGRWDAIMALLASGSDLNQKNHQGESPLFFLFNEPCSVYFLEGLLPYNPDFEIVNKSGKQLLEHYTEALYFSLEALSLIYQYVYPPKLLYQPALVSPQEEDGSLDDFIHGNEALFFNPKRSVGEFSQAGIESPNPSFNPEHFTGLDELLRPKGPRVSSSSDRPFNPEDFTDLDGLLLSKRPRVSPDHFASLPTTHGGELVPEITCSRAPSTDNRGPGNTPAFFCRGGAGAAEVPVRVISPPPVSQGPGNHSHTWFPAPRAGSPDPLEQQPASVPDISSPETLSQ